MDDRLRANIATGAWPVLDEEVLSEPLRQPLRHQARDDVGAAAGGKADDQAHRPRRIGLRPCDTQHGRHGGSTRYQMQKLAAWDIHNALRSRHALMPAALMIGHHFSISAF